MYQVLKNQGERVCEHTMAQVMKPCGIRTETRRKFIPRTTDSRHANSVADNLLDRNFQARLPNRKWAVDIPYVPTHESWLYLAGVMDLGSRRIIG